MYSDSIVSSITLCLLDVILLGLEEFILLVCLLYTTLHILASYFEISLLAHGFEESLVGMIFYLDLITHVDLL
jgi:hypothetical protein